MKRPQNYATKLVNLKDNVRIDCLPYTSFAFTNIFNSYIQRDEHIKSFFETDPFNNSEVEKHLQDISFTGDRKETVSWLLDFNSAYDIPKKSRENIDKFELDNSLAVVTGQQCTVMGGPLFTVYKIITAIVKANEWQKKLNRPVIPVFWIADEDHDFQEAAQFSIQTREDCKLFEYDDRSEEGKRVADITFSDELSKLKDNLRSELYETDFSDDLWNMLDVAYKPGNTFGKAFGQLILDLFGKYGLVLAGSNTKRSKKIVSDTMALSVTRHQLQFDALQKQSEMLKDAGFKNQVHLNASNIFYIDQSENRKKIQFENNHWVIPDLDINWRSEELVNDIQKNPEKFSPNVFLRPILQDKLLPVASYVAGPGEVAYYAQMKAFYKQFDMKMPIITPRFSATLVESGIERIIQKLPFSIPEYSQRIEDLESEFINKTDSPDVEKIFGIWQNRIKSESEESIQQISDIDPTLKKSAEKSVSVFFNELDRLKGKLYKSLKDSEKTQINRIEKIKLNLFPNRNLQEREIAFIYFMNKYGTDLWDHILESLTTERPDSHKIIYL
jgi:bacillithiol biosynthesis cysteine-adding enzyme BshC